MAVAGEVQADAFQVTAPRASLPACSPHEQLLRARLGIASSLFTSLRYRHPETAAHSLRVTLGCASWALVLGMSDEQRDIIEVAALLHDIGKIGLPDCILNKTTPLNAAELQVLEEQRLMGSEILRASSACPAVLEIVEHSVAWYDGSKSNSELSGSAIPLGARLLCIADAFDMLTSTGPGRRALTHDKAMAEIFRHAGTQFDPGMVKVFAALHEHDQSSLHEQVAERWVRSLDSDQSQAMWQVTAAQAAGGSRNPVDDLFQQRLLDNIRDAVVFVDNGLRVMHWNPGSERMTGIPADAVKNQRFVPELLDMRDEDGITLLEEECLLADAMLCGEQRLRRLTVRGRGNKDVSIEAHIVPVIGPDNAVHGATLVMRDVSPEISLEARCQSLHEMATKDPLTRVANRAEFNRVHAMFVAAHLERELPCSLIICDIDHFKQVNDNYGHPAGDEVLKSFARLLKSSCRPGDLAARYGGEEFVMLCADCNASTAARRAEEIRKLLTQIAHPALDSKRITASFGVTEIQRGDTPETMLARADRGLYDAKENGRNAVVQLGTGLSGNSGETVLLLNPNRGDLLAEQDLVTYSPIAVAIEKLRGFVSDHHAEIMQIEPHEVRLKVGGGGGFSFRRRSDRHVPLLVTLNFEEHKNTHSGGDTSRGMIQTNIRIAISPVRSRDRRREDVIERARQLLASFRAYLMAQETTTSIEAAVASQPDAGAKKQPAKR